MKEAQKIRQKNTQENKKELDQLYEKLINLNFEKETGRLKKVHQIKKAKKQIARLLTIIQEDSKGEIKTTPKLTDVVSKS